jgi:hypothetical protein
VFEEVKPGSVHPQEQALGLKFIVISITSGFGVTITGELPCLKT